MLLNAYEHFVPSNYAPIKERTRQKLRAMLSKGHEPKFTHCDIINRDNLIVRSGIVVPVDWLMTGWYPSFWEYVSADGVLYEDDWPLGL